MPRKNRAAQFAPFNALKGLQESLREREYEQEKTLKKELTEEEIENLEKTFLKLKNKDCVEVLFYDKKDLHYKTVCGELKICNSTKQMDVVSEDEKTTHINFEDILTIKLRNKNLPI